MKEEVDSWSCGKAVNECVYQVEGRPATLYNDEDEPVKGSISSSSSRLIANVYSVYAGREVQPVQIDKTRRSQKRWTRTQD